MSLETLGGWIKLAAKGAADAEARGDTAAVARFATIGISGIEAKRRAVAATEHSDGFWYSNAEVDAARKTVRERFDRLAQAALDEGLAKQASWAVCSACGQKIDPAPAAEKATEPKGTQ